MPIKCKICNTLFDNYYQLSKHKIKEHNDNLFECEKCHKVLCSKQKFNSHISICNGIDGLTCQYCLMNFENKYIKYRHNKNCKFKLNPENENNIQINISNSSNITNNITNITNNITNNIVNINLVKFELDSDKNTDFVSSHITYENMKEMIDATLHNKNNNQHFHLELLNKYSTHLFKQPENRCVKKTNIKSKYSKVYVGLDKWNIICDNNLYQKLVMDATKNMINKLDDTEDKIKPKDKYNKKIYTLRGQAEPFTNYIFEDEKELKKQLNIAEENMKCLMMNIH